MSSLRVLKLVLLVSCAHALVHLLEQSIASVELVISNEFTLNLEQSGWLGLALRLPYGLGAFASGLLADRFGEKRILVLYLLGSAAVSMSFMGSETSSVVYAQLFALGVFGSMYHPAGLALLANNTTPAERARALGTHGIFGSLGIASAPFIAGVTLSLRPGDWRGYYLLLGIISAALAVIIWLLLNTDSPESDTDTTEPVDDRSDSKPLKTPVPSSPQVIEFQIWPYVLLVVGTAMSGIVYGGVLHFLPRYLTDSGAFSQLETLLGREIPESALGNYAAALALVCGAFGQWTAGRIARPERLPIQLALVYAANIPFLVWMTYADGGMRLLAACFWAFVHFMNQPLYNSLLPQFIPVHRRSAGFGFSNMMGFGLGALGPPLVGIFDERFADYTVSYSAFAVFAFLAALLPIPLMSKRFVERLKH